MRSETINLLIARSKQYPLLSHHLATLLNIRRLGGDQQARETLINSNIRLAVHISTQFSHCGVEFDDIVGFALTGLIAGVDKWDHKKGKLSVYAGWWIRQSILRGLGETGALIRRPIGTVKHFKNIRKTCGEEHTARVDNMSYDQIAEVSGERLDRVKDLMPFVRPFLSLDHEYTDHDSDGTTLMDLLATPHDPGHDDRERTQAVQHTLGVLTDRERDIVVKYYGLDGSEPQTLDQIGMAYKITRERIRQIKEQALIKIERRHNRILQDAK